MKRELDFIEDHPREGVKPEDGLDWKPTEPPFPKSKST